MELTKEQLATVKKAIGDGSTWPSTTCDPIVNHRVDQLVSDPKLPGWDNLPEDEKELYREEVIELRNRYGEF